LALLWNVELFGIATGLRIGPSLLAGKQAGDETDPANSKKDKT
jgi:hypothetical protein